MVGDVWPRRVLTVASGTPLIMNEPRRKGMAEVVEVEVRQSRSLTGPLKAVSHVIPPIPGRIVVRSSFLILRGVIAFSLHFSTS